MSSQIVTQYSSMSKALHWIIAIAVIGMLSVGFFLDDLPDQLKPIAYMIHKSTGLTILLLMIIRFIWVHASGKPALPDTVKIWEKILSRFVQYGFYILLIAMPLSGWIMSVAADRPPIYFGLFKVDFPGIGVNKPLAEYMAGWHEIIAWTLIAFIILHVAGALKHHFIDKDNVLKTMWPARK